ncbi:PLC-like phosphodiesterase [Tilletiopsis washingtonensis]|uniref:Phosphoinositide phospholipase C n=1 Tax=Tilletiopsis washingtonensis TaxID=58919 RepID=A0A316ZA01_9BASI|nr:PLC-like phosphodiesterase [Tilletiopsis washingtonensis]PWN97782.1 PLC-like phosphodiesterase [Tilletiopsis washingtonensis]
MRVGKHEEAHAASAHSDAGLAASETALPVVAESTSREAEPRAVSEQQVEHAAGPHVQAPEQSASTASSGDASTAVLPETTLQASPETLATVPPATPMPIEGAQLPPPQVSAELALSSSPPVPAPSPIPGVPPELARGEPMLKVTQKKVMQRSFRLDTERGQILWDSKKNNKVNLEAIREVRVGASAASYRTALSISSAHAPRWLSIIYQSSGVYKALHLIALSDASLARWRDTLGALHSLRAALLGGASGAEGLDERQQLWLRQHWRVGDTNADSRLAFDEVVRLCRRIGIESSRKMLRAAFAEADAQARGWLDFEAFQRFVGVLKRREDIESIWMEWADVELDEQSGTGDAVGTGAAGDAVAPGAAGDKQPDLGDIGASPSAAAEFQANTSPTPRADAHRRAATRAMSRARFCAFLRDEQRLMDTLPPQLEALFERYAEHDENEPRLRLDGFAAFLLSADNAVVAADARPSGSGAVAAAAAVAVSPRDAAVLRSRAAAQTTEALLQVGARAPDAFPSKTHHDMTHPLSDYYISSSHNTYLVGGQWKGDSTVEGYVRALQGGARSVELDCWDGPNDTPHITHGHTLTSKVPFVDVITAIGRYAFVSSPCPLILSLEVHNDVPQQEIMASILRSVLGPMLLSEHLVGRDGAELPSPEELRGKILIKTKNLALVAESPRPEQPVTEAVCMSEASTDTTESDGDTLRDLVRSVTKRGSSHSGSGSQKPAAKVLMAPSLSALLIYTVGVKHRGINKKETYAPEHMISLSERSAFRYARTAAEDLIKHNLTHLTRVYPSMASLARLHASANFLPHHVWATGSQLVALNWQTMDLGFELNRAMFQRNGRCGYVLKPEALRIREVYKSAPKRLRFEVRVTIVSAQQLPRFKDASRDRDSEEGDVIDPFVALSLLAPEGWGRQPSVNGDAAVRPSDALAAGRRSSSSGTLLPPPPPEGRIGSYGSTATPAAPPGRTLRKQASSSSASSSSSSTPWPRARTAIVRANGFNPQWRETLALAVDVPAGSDGASEALLSQALAAVQRGGGAASEADLPLRALARGLLDLAFLRFEVCDAEQGGEPTCLAACVTSLGAMQRGYRHLPLYDAQLTPYMFSTLFVRTHVVFLGLAE